MKKTALSCRLSIIICNEVPPGSRKRRQSLDTTDRELSVKPGHCGTGAICDVIRGIRVKGTIGRHVQVITCCCAGGAWHNSFSIAAAISLLQREINHLWHPQQERVLHFVARQVTSPNTSSLPPCSRASSPNTNAAAPFVQPVWSYLHPKERIVRGKFLSGQDITPDFFLNEIQLQGPGFPGFDRRNHSAIGHIDGSVSSDFSLPLSQLRRRVPGPLLSSPTVDTPLLKYPLSSYNFRRLARWAYLSLYQMHLLSVYGVTKTIYLSLSRFLGA